MGKKKKTKIKTPTREQLVKQCDVLWSKCVRARHRTCRICGSDYRLQAHHIRSRSHSSTRYDLENGMALCSRCHIIQKFNPEKFQDSVIEVIGQAEYERLKKKSLIPWKYTVPMLQDIKLDLQVGLKHDLADYGKIAEDCGL